MAPLGNGPPAEFFDARKSPRPFRTAANDNGNVNNFMWVTRPNPHSTGERRPLAVAHFYFAVPCSHDPSHRFYPEGTVALRRRRNAASFCIFVRFCTFAFCLP